MKKIIVLAMSLVSSVSFGQGFSGDFDPSLWVISDPIPVGGSVNTSGAPGSITLTGGDNGNGGDYDYSLTYGGACAATISFDWEVIHPDCGWDNIYYGVNGVYVFLTDCSGTGNVSNIILNPGDVLTFRVNTEDGIAGAPDFIISNLVNAGGFQVSDWTTTQNNSDGTVDETQAPCQITITGPDNGSLNAGDINYSYTATGCGTITFDWSIVHPDCGADDFNYTINGVTTYITNCDGSGTTGPISIVAGDEFAFQIYSYDNIVGAPVVTISNIVIAYDNGGPVPDLANLPDLNGSCEVATLTPPTATDVCDGSFTGVPDMSPPFYSSTTITWTYTDNQGNSTYQYQNVFVNDFTPPTPDVATLPDIEGYCSVTPDYPTATDDCGGPVDVYPSMTFPITAPGTYLLEWYYYDQNGNFNYQTQNVTVIADTAAPVLTAPADVTVDFNSTTCMSEANDTTFYYISLADFVNPNTNGLLCFGTVDVYYCGQTAEFSWLDASAATPDQVVIEYFALYNDFGAYPTQLNGVSQSDYMAPLSTGCGNEAVYSQSMNVADYFVGGTNTITMDVIGCVLWDVNPDPNWMADSYIRVMVITQGVQLGAATVADDCSGASVSNDAPGVFPVGTTTVTWTAVDAAGNTATATQMVTVNGVNAGVTYIFSDSTFVADNTVPGATYQWIDCVNGNTPIDGETDSVLQITQNGGYALIVTIGDCSDTSDCQLIFNLGVPADQINTFSLYPNPADQVLNISTNAYGVIELLDINGRVIMVGESKGDIVEFDIQTVQPGAYSVRFTTETSTEVKRVIIK